MSASLARMPGWAGVATIQVLDFLDCSEEVGQKCLEQFMKTDYSGDGELCLEEFRA